MLESPENEPITPPALLLEIWISNINNRKNIIPTATINEIAANDTINSLSSLFFIKNTS